MFIREKPNKSGSVSVQIISKENRRNKVVKTIGSSRTREGIDLLLHQARHELNTIKAQASLFDSQDDLLIESFLQTLSNLILVLSGLN